ncbi:MAG: hypothetical protein SWQ30_19220 [Thermodesulfobacteriota bacterium]|nr:hypothetical protein [Thermodesulfobacteriota bacterium]
MKRSHQLIKLRKETVQTLRRLKIEMGESSLDDLINTMIRITYEYRVVLKDPGWNTSLEKRDDQDHCRIENVSGYPSPKYGDSQAVAA